MAMTRLPGTIFHAIPGFEDHLAHELGSSVIRVPDNVRATDNVRYADNESAGKNAASLFYSPGPPEQVFWYQNAWLEPFTFEFDSITQAASRLREFGRNWAPVLSAQYRRGSLIASKLPPLPDKTRTFPWLVPDTPMGAFTLTDAHTVIASPVCSSPFPRGIARFEEDRVNPPSRAYLKLWEALTLCRARPGPGDTCLDAGASPGGWTWALAKTGACVTAVDRAPLDPRLDPKTGGPKNVRFLRHDAFTLKPEDLGPLDWLFCDVICYPPKLLEWIEKWLASGLCENFICTIKMQGNADGTAAETRNAAADFETPKRFAALPGGRVVHLYHNKHELTWIKVTARAPHLP